MSNLIIGWEVTQNLEPKYWLGNSAKPGAQGNTDVVRVLARDLATHSIIIGQSGSGKSAFLGRIIEEMTLRTRAQFVILDSNADFGYVHVVQPTAMWDQAAYSLQNRSGKLPHERSREEFLTDWQKVEMRILTARVAKLGVHPQRTEPYGRLMFWMASLSGEFRAEQMDIIQRAQLYHCVALGKAIVNLAILESSMISPDYVDPIKRIKDVFSKYFLQKRKSGGSISDSDVRNLVEQEFNISKLLWAIPNLKESMARTLGLNPDWLDDPKSIEVFRRNMIMSWIYSVALSLQYISSDMADIYLSAAHEYNASGLLSPTPLYTDSNPERFRVFDLASISNRGQRLWAANAIVEDVFQRARHQWEIALDSPEEEDSRVPTFIVLDEAHNLIPAEPRGRTEATLREQFRTIAAEGRKLGMFLILASQRPDKLDPMVLSECENKAIMRVNSESVLNLTSEILGLGDVQLSVMEKCLDCGIGRALIMGRWARQGPKWVYSAARRTAEGGRNLRAEFWAVPPNTSGTRGDNVVAQKKYKKV